MSSNTPVVSATDASNFPAPSGLQVVQNAGYVFEDYPILLYNGHTFWPLSYVDNRWSFAIVITTGSTTNIINTFEAPGARYIESIQVYSGNQTVSFIGQSADAASVLWSRLRSEASITVTPTSTTGSATSGITTLPTSTSTLSSAHSPSNSDAAPASAGGQSLSGGTIAGVVIGSFFGLIILGIVSWLVYKWLNPSTEPPTKLAAALPAPVPGPATRPPSGSERPPSPAAPPGENQAWVDELADRVARLNAEKPGGRAATPSQATATVVNSGEEDDKSGPMRSFPKTSSPTSPEHSSVLSGDTGGSFPTPLGPGPA
ncbi:hypothetical protein DL764_005223 [Monosporascus ibericus]|uniref:Mid2 domain-containing protein n=1 Tax=Monosporascus ibericus TaxID=155417 RepID=A0A4Q4TDA7_9PEZI|nr:hypothetical protein DL764_005223 [Monosporascus ibericus]